jgi:predicted ribosome quality control (RQC) complex YloA/Tae2 family protein
MSNTNAIKSRFDSLDVTAMVAWMQRNLAGRRVVNVYDGESGESYIFKLDGSYGKCFLLVESGIRFHPLEHFDAGKSMPSPFCAKLRKHMRGLRLEHIQQLGLTDRVILMQFGSGASRHSLILELYAKGNLILTNAEYSILALLRSHTYSNTADAVTSEITGEKRDGDVTVQIGNVYPVSLATTTSTNDPNQNAATGMLSPNYLDWVKDQVDAAALDFENSTGKKKKKAILNLKGLLLKPASGVSHFGPSLLEHAILTANLSPYEPIGLLNLQAGDWKSLKDACIVEAPSVLERLQQAATADTPAYILYRLKNNDGGEKEFSDVATPLPCSGDLPHADKILQEYVPHLLKQHEGRSSLQYENFGIAVADFYAHLGNQKRVLKAQSAEAAAKQKLEKTKQDQQERHAALEREQELVFEHATIVQHNADFVDKALAVVNSALDSGMDWDQLEQLVEIEQSNGNPIAKLIDKLELEQESMVLSLPQNALEPDASPKILARISLKDSAHANANNLFARYRASKEKAVKTIEASAKVFQAAEESAKKQLMEAQKRSKQSVNLAKRKPLWFEKFHWFVTSDNYLVLGGKDAHQNELLVKRYLRAGDAYLHADVHGAASCILRAKRHRRTNGKTEPVPLSDQALREAGNFTICRSSAWSSRMITSAWWVESHQVSKTAPSGEYLTVGSFMIRGKKTFLPPSQLEMGLAVMFRISDDDTDALARHKNERRDFAFMALEDNANDDNSLPAINVSSKEILSSNCTELPAADESYQNIDESKKSTYDMNRHETKDESDQVVVEKNGIACIEGNSDTKKGLSVRDRKLIKKYGSLEEAQRNGNLSGKLPARLRLDGNDSEENAVVSSDKTEVVMKHAKRGKRAKMKRAMKKYGDQDDEDKELAMLALQGGEKAKKPSKVMNISETQRQMVAETTTLLLKDSAQTAMKLSDNTRAILAECVTVKCVSPEPNRIRWDKLDAETIEQLLSLEPEEAQLAAVTRLRNLMTTTRIDNFSASLGGIVRRVQKHGFETLNNDFTYTEADKAKRKSKEEKLLEKSQWKETLAEEGVLEADLDEDLVDDTVELSRLTGKPQEDLLLFAIPVCAPYQTLSQYAYRVKLTPGNMKRGKAAKQCIDMLTRYGDGPKPALGTEQCVELIKKVSDNDWLQCICSDVKVSAPGASKLAKTTKANSKKAMKSK